MAVRHLSAHNRTLPHLDWPFEDESVVHIYHNVVTDDNERMEILSTNALNNYAKLVELDAITSK